MLLLPLIDAAFRRAAYADLTWMLAIDMLPRRYYAAPLPHALFR